MSIATLEQDLETATIFDLPDLVEQLPPDRKEVFGRFYRLQMTSAPMVYASEDAKKHVAGLFKTSEENVSERRVLRITNFALKETSLWSLTRAGRPIRATQDGDQMKAIHDASPTHDCDMCHSKERAPHEPYDEPESELTATCANAGPYESQHEMAVPKDVHRPLDLTIVHWKDMFRTGNQSLLEAYRHHPQAKFPGAVMNGYPRAGSSVLHPHYQTFLAEGEPYEKVDQLRESLVNYRDKHSYPLLDEMVYGLEELGLVHRIGSARIIFNLSPTKEKEVLIYTKTVDDRGNHLVEYDFMPNDDFAEAVGSIHEFYRDELGATSFNIAVYMPPLAPDYERSWIDFTAFGRVLERGSEKSRVADFGGMEIYFASVVSSDPLVLSRSFRDFRAKKLAA